MLNQLSVVSLICLVFIFHSFGGVKAEGCEQGTYKSSLSETCLEPYSGEDMEAFKRPMSFTMRQVSIRAETTWIAAEGIITTETPDVFRKFLDSNVVYTENRIEFNSPGGNLYAAMELGRIIRDRGNATTIGHTLTLENPEFSMDVIEFDGAVCFSACAYAFLGGQKRYLNEKGQLGVHRFGSDDYEISSDEAQSATSDVARYLEEMGVDQRLLQIASRISFKDDIFIIDTTIAEELRVSFDPNIRSSRFEVSLLGKNVVANTTVFHQGFQYAARLHCIDKIPSLVVWGPKEQLPHVFHDMKNLDVEFKSGETGFYAKVNSGLLKSGNGYVTFSGFELPKALINNGKIELAMIWPKDWNSMELFDRMRWTDMVVWFSFTMNIENSQTTVPIIMRECS